MLKPLRDLRKGSGLTQKEFAERVGVSLSMYEKVERGTIQASRNFIGKVKAEFSHISIDYIFFSHGQHYGCLLRGKEELIK